MAKKNKARSRKRPATDLAPRRQAKGGASEITGVGPQPSPARSSHPGGVNVVMCDGSVRN
jgi:prepilin-type processing-associated H-X9-DG protein